MYEIKYGFCEAKNNCVKYIWILDIKYITMFN